jgi:hypothetical protein
MLGLKVIRLFRQLHSMELGGILRERQRASDRPFGRIAIRTSLVSKTSVNYPKPIRALTIVNNRRLR